MHAEPPDSLDGTFIEAIARGWGLSLNCQPCGVYTRWTDAELAKRFLRQLDQNMSKLRGRVKCPECKRTDLRIYPYQAGAMNWREPLGQVSDMLATTKAHKAELREMARAAADPAPQVGSYAGAKMRI